ncbi:MAG: acyl-CoA desaturase [Balneolaceae bacterium]|nr:acyl-CoA desaturase [Balneolaceae bacterium]
MEAPYIPEEYDEELDRINWLSGSGFILLHLGCMLIFWAGFSWVALGAMILSYLVRMFGITAGFHRYFSHRSYKTSRIFQFILAWIGTSSAQKGPLWWAAHHRHHHKHSDTEKDLHSPARRGFWWSHVGWILSNRFKDTNKKLVGDLLKFPELRFLNSYHLLPPIVLAAATYLFGELLNYYLPWLGTSGFQMLVYGFVVSTVLLYHGTFTVNSLAHVVGKKRFKTNDDSRNNWFISLITLGEGWHNNHHRFPSSERQGFYWWEIDVSHYCLRVLSWFRLVWDLRVPPERVYADRKRFKRPPDVIERP